MSTLEFYWDFSSPFAYLASTQIDGLVQRTGATLIDCPMLLGGVFRAIGQVDVPLAAMGEAKQRYMMADIHRWAKYWNVPFAFPSRFPMNSLKALRAYLALPEARRVAFRSAVYRAYWGEDRDISSDAVLAEYIGPDAALVLQQTQDPQIKQALVAATNHAVAQGVFGAPTFVIDGRDLYWGQDRMVLVEQALSGAA
jgi:2-hydroxychromene-2-carboxylate isomerase